jgi:hypothetical protein
MSDAPDPVDPPLIVFTVPGKWRDAADFAARLAATPGGYTFDLAKAVIRNADTDRTQAAELLPRDPALKDVFFLAGGGRTRKADALAVGNHVSAVRLRGFGGSDAAAVEMMRLATAVLASGGVGVFVDSSGIAHTKDDWLKLAGDPKSGGRYWAFVTLVSGTAGDGGPGGFYSCGMHALGHPDVITNVVADPQEGWSLVHQFNGYVHQSGVEMHDGDPLGNEFGTLWKVRHERCEHYAPGELYHNPYGMWRIVSTGDKPTDN